MKKLIVCSRGQPLQQQQQVLANHPSVTFEWEEILNGTQNFRESNVLGEGNFGRAYRCDLPGHNAVGAAKIQRYNNSNRQTEFETEITTLHRANHPNVIRLLGKSVFRNGTLCIVYELMPKGSLDHHLFGTKPINVISGQAGSTGLDWNKRIRIALGVAEALVYLHNVLKVIHRDIKSSNVLLDADFAPKLTDFGLASRIVENENGVELTRSVYPFKGTRGFLAPETLQAGYVSTKSDVYGYGVFLFELFTGRKAFDTTRPSATKILTHWLRSVGYSEDNMHRVIDLKLGTRYPVEGLRRVFQVANMCIEEEASARPSMDVVEQMIRQASSDNSVPDIPTRLSI